MTRAQPDIEAIFFVAQHKGAADRAAYLDEVCGDDLALRQRVEQFLRVQAEIGSFLEASVPHLGPTIEEPVRERPGTVIGPYRLMEQIGEGGMGLVFVAEQQDPVRRKVALKVIKPGMDSREVIARFEAERQALALMDHPNIAHVHDGGTTPSGRPYFVMELVKGVPITDYCDENHLAVRERLELFIDVCQAVQHAHQKGIIHRDLKPSNVLVASHDGTPVVKVIDFGVAKAIGQQLTEKTVYTGFTQMVGTPLYMSPEQAGMSGLDVDTRSDIYALGVLLYELLTGTTPFDGERLREAGYDEMRRIIREEEPARPSTRISTLGQAAVTVSANRQSDAKHLSQTCRGELDWIVMKALEKDRNRRYESASTLAADVERYLADEPVEACPPSRWYRVRKFARRHKAGLATATALAAALLVAVSSLIGAVAVLAASNEEVREEQRQTKKALDGEKEAKDKLLEALARGERSLYFNRIALAERELAANNIGRAEELLTECPEKLRGWEWHFLKRRVHEPTQVIRATKNWVLDVASSPDGRYLATASLSFLFQGEVKLWDAATGKEAQPLRGSGVSARSLTFSPDGSQLAAGGLNKVVLIWDVLTGKQLRALKGHDGWVLSVAYSPDGKHLATASEDGTARVWDASTGAEELRFPSHAAPVHCVAYSPDGRRLASWGMDFHLRVWDASTGEEQQRLAGHSGRVFNLHFHKDERHLVSAGADGMRLWDLKTGEKRAIKGINSACLRALFSPDGERLVSALWDNSVQVWDWRNEQEVLSLREHTSMVMGLAWCGAPAPRVPGRLASAGFDGTVRVWNATPLALDPPRRGRLLQGHHEGQCGLVFSPDGRYLVTASMDGSAKLWEVGTGKLIHTLTGLDTTYPSAGFHAGGKLLTTVTVDGTMVQWDVATGKRRQTWRSHLGPILNTGFAVWFTADGEQFASVTRDGSIGVWETASGKEITRVPPAFPPYMTAFLSPDGKHLAAASVGIVHILEVKSGESVTTLPGVLHMAHHMAFSADGRRLAAAYWDGTVKVWDIQEAKTLHTFRHGDRATGVAFHPSGRQLASGSCDNTAKVWDLDTGQEIATLRGHIGYVMGLAYSPDGKLLATASGHRYWGEVQLWDTVDFGKKR
jgi:WD40 repeat protein/serine/threonine protein kinase